MLNPFSRVPEQRITCTFADIKSAFYDDSDAEQICNDNVRELAVILTSYGSSDRFRDGKQTPLLKELGKSDVDYLFSYVV